MGNEGSAIRLVEGQDAADLRENCFSMNTLEEVRERIADCQREYAEGKTVLLVAEVDGRVVGTATLQRNAHPLLAHRGELDSLVVAPEYQRRGIARRLVEAIGERAREMGIEILETSCRGGEPAEQVYPALGFIEYGRLPRGIKEPWGEGRVYDEVFFYRV